MPRVTWTIDADDRPLRRKLLQLDRAAARTGSRLNKLGQGIGSSGRPGGLGGSGSGGGLSDLTAGGLASRLGPLALGAGLATSITGLAKLGGQLETTRIQFGTFLGSVERGNALLDELSTFANFTPFSNEKVNASARSLLSFGLAGENIIPTLKTLGDISAGTGKDLTELAIIYGQIKSTGRLLGQDLLQLINAGFNPLQEISRTTGKSVSDLKDEMSKGLISFEQVEAAFKSATSEGGLFVNLTEKLSNSFEGKLSTALGKGRFLLQQIGEKILPAVNKVLDGMISLIDQAGQANLNPLLDLFVEMRDLVMEVKRPLDELFSSLDLGLSNVLEGFNVFQGIIDFIALNLRQLTLPLRETIKAFNLIAESGEAIKDAFRGVGLILAGVAQRNVNLIREGFRQAQAEGNKALENFRAGFKDFFANEAQKNLQLIQNFGRPQGRDTGASTTSGALSDAAATSPRSTTSGSGTRRSSTRGGISGGRGISNFDIRIQNLVETITFNRVVTNTEAELEAIVARALTNAVNDVQRLTGQ